MKTTTNNTDRKALLSIRIAAMELAVKENRKAGKKVGKTVREMFVLVAELRSL